MSLVTIFSCLTTVLSCGLLGILFSLSFKNRTKQLEELYGALDGLLLEINFKNSILSESIEKVGKNCTGAVHDMLLYISKSMLDEKCADIEKIWRRATERFGGELFLTQEDIEILLDFSKKLGCGDRECEKNNISLALARLKLALDNSRELASKNGKVYRGLGFLAGIFLVVVFL